MSLIGDSKLSERKIENGETSNTEPVSNQDEIKIQIPITTEPPCLTNDSSYSPVKGILFSILTTISIVTGRAIFKYIDDMNFIVLHLTTYIALTIATLPFLALVRKSDYTFAWNWKWPLLTMGTILNISIIFEQLAIIELPLGTATTIFYTRPVMVLGVAIIMKLEKLEWSKVILCVIAIVGVTLVVRPLFLFPDHASKSEGIWWAYFTAFGQAICLTVYCILLRVTKDVHFVIVSVVSVAIGMILSVAILPFEGDLVFPATALDYFWVSLSGVLACAAGFLMTLAHHYYDASAISTTRTLDVVVSFLFGIFMFDDRPPWLSGIGATLVVLSIVGLGLAEFVKHRNIQRKTCVL